MAAGKGRLVERSELSSRLRVWITRQVNGRRERTEGRTASEEALLVEYGHRVYEEQGDLKNRAKEHERHLCHVQPDANVEPKKILGDGGIKSNRKCKWSCVEDAQFRQRETWTWKAAWNLHVTFCLLFSGFLDSISIFE